MKFFTYIKSILALLVVVAFMVQALELPIKKAWQRVAQESFENRYCQNLEFPELDCHGSCHIQQIASSHSHQDSNHPQINTVQLDVNLFFESIEMDLNPPIFLSEKMTQLPYYQGYVFISYEEIFHPPTLG